MGLRYSAISAYEKAAAWLFNATLSACVASTTLVPHQRAHAQGSIEHTFGASNVEAITGNQRLAVGVSQEGDLSVLAWSSPTFYDQRHYIAVNGTEAREMPRMGALEGMRSYAAPDQHQIGPDTTDTCSLLDQLGDNIDEVLATTGEQGLPIDPAALDQLRCGDFNPYASIAAREGWLYVPQDARLDLEDGELEGGLMAGAQVNTALRVPLTDEGAQSVATIYFAFGYNDQGAQSALDTARGRGFDAIADEAEEVHRDWAGRVFIPEGFSETMERFSLRAFLNLRVGTDRDTGAIVASITRFDPYLTVLPSADEAFALDPPDDDEGGGAGEGSGDGCTTVDSSASISSVLLLTLLTVFIARRLAHLRACGPL